MTSFGQIVNLPAFHQASYALVVLNVSVELYRTRSFSTAFAAGKKSAAGLAQEPLRFAMSRVEILKRKIYPALAVRQ
jgi:hypothetical protein